MDMFLLLNVGLFSNVEGTNFCQPVPTKQIPRREPPRVIRTVKEALLVNTVPNPISYQPKSTFWHCKKPSVLETQRLHLKQNLHCFKRASGSPKSYSMLGVNARQQIS